ncbi:MAG TPA: cytochrome c3 family protein [Candidatus Polarisedimenticolia bacterium]|nr:cytochrome c3 family protein [Candidatus Polarisedimenticolia bacterium]
MKRTRIVWVIVATAFAAFGFGSAAYAFHEGGVAECSGCHSMHGSPAADYLLISSDQSSTCLSCHESDTDTGPRSYHISTAASQLTNATDIPLQRSPGGDFGWLRQDLVGINSRGGNEFNNGEDRGHNIVAADNSYVADATPQAPGGIMNSTDLSCVSCHDPHSRARRIPNGNVVYPPSTGTYEPILAAGSYGAVPVAGEAVGVYRLLGGSAYTAYPSGPTFPGVPAAVAPSTYNRTEMTTQTRVVYGHGTANGYASWGQWCATCHPDMHTVSSPNLVHEVDGQLNGPATIYNKYVKTGDLTATSGDSFTSLVPYAMNTSDVTMLAPKALTNDSDLSGPLATDRIACLSCHRAHASGWPYMMRWNSEAEYLTLGAPASPVYPGTDAGLGNQGQFNLGYTTAQMAAAYYDRPATVFAGHQRSLCNKCHNKD